MNTIQNKNSYTINPIFKSYYNKPWIKKVNPDYLYRADYLIPFVDDANLTLNKLEKTKNPMAKNLLDFLKKELKLFKFNVFEKSLVFNNGKSNYIVSTDGKTSITFQEQNKETGAIEKTIQTKNRSIVAQSDSVKQIDSAEDFLQKVLDSIDFALLKYRKITSNKDNLEIINNSNFEPVLNDSLEKVDFVERGILPTELINEITEIEKSYTKIFESLDSISNPGTRSRLKNDYFNILKTPRGTRNLGFQKDGYNLFVNFVNDHTKRYLVIQKGCPNGEVQNLILNKDGKAYKQKSLQCLKENRASVEFYTQAEIESEEFKNIIREARKELENYSEFIQERINMKDSRAARLSTSQIGIINSKILNLCAEAKNKYDDCRTALATVHDKNKKDKAKEFFGLSSRAGSPSVILRNVTKNKEDLQISFPMVNGIQCTKILVLEGVDSIKQSFFIMEDKLVKFEAKQLGRSARADNRMNYYSQEEIDSFNIEEHLETIVKKLEQATTGIYNKDYIN